MLVVGGTVRPLLGHLHLKPQSIDLLLVDEASMMFFPLMMPLLTKYAKPPGRQSLAGWRAGGARGGEGLGAAGGGEGGGAEMREGGGRGALGEIGQRGVRGGGGAEGRAGAKTPALEQSGVAVTRAGCSIGSTEAGAIGTAAAGTGGLVTDLVLLYGGRLVLGGDHRQLPCILQHDFDAELRPLLMKWRVGRSAYDYIMQLAQGEQSFWVCLASKADVP